MRNVILSMLAIALMASCGEGGRSESMHYDLKCRLVSTNEDQGFSHDKYRRPVACRLWLVQSLEDTTMFAEIKDCEGYMDIDITDELWYNKKIGDTLHYDRIRRDRFFKLKGLGRHAE